MKTWRAVAVFCNPGHKLLPSLLLPTTCISSTTTKQQQKATNKLFAPALCLWKSYRVENFCLMFRFLENYIWLYIRSLVISLHMADNILWNFMMVLWWFMMIYDAIPSSSLSLYLHTWLWNFPQGPSPQTSHQRTYKYSSLIPTIWK